MSTRFRKMLCLRDGSDIIVGEFVRRAGRKGIGIAGKVEHGFTWVTWAAGRKDYLPVTVLRPVKHRGEEYDRRRTL